MTNICKFPPPCFYRPLTVSCFVMETDAETMKRSTPLKNHRMLLVMQGQGSFCFDGHSVAFCSGTLLFGFEGEIFSVKPMGADMLYEIVFDKAGTKKLMASFAKLKKI